MESRETALARRICCAVLSYNQGISYAHCWKTYFAEKEDVGEMWHEVARYADQLFMAAQNAISERLTSKIGKPVQ